jgi:FkbM family methyltransferase
MGFVVALILVQPHAHRVNTKPVNVAPLSTLKSNLCKCVFLDVGSNIGVHVHKLYEPGAYKPSPYTGVFERNFDRNECPQRDNVCSVTFEANMAHNFRQELLARHNQERGRNAWAIHTAVGPPTGWLRFAMGDTTKNEAWGFGLHSPVGTGAQSDVYSISLSEFVLQFLREEQHVLMKMDIEGSEYLVLEDMIKTGAIALIDEVTAEFHPNTLTKETFDRQKSSLEKMWRNRIQRNGCAVEFIDDESNLHDQIPLEVDIDLLACGSRKTYGHAFLLLCAVNALVIFFAVTHSSWTKR